jgi:KDO2-lipid IV(A) lauroyltransferase
METACVQVLVRCLPLLTRRGLVRCARGLGWAAFHLLRRQRRIALANLDVAFGETKSRAEKKRIALQSMQQFALTLMGLLWSQRMTRETLDTVVTVNPEHLDRARLLTRGDKGVIFITLHYGDWEMLGLGAGFLGMPLHVVTETMRNAGLEEIFMRLRTRSGNTIVPQAGAAMRLLRALRQKKAVALVIDLNAPSQSGGMWLNFFGLPVYNNTAAAALALRTGARIVGASCVSLPDGRVRLEYGREIACESTGDDEADIRRISQECLDYCEEVIRREPEHWLWSYKRWKHRREKKRGRYPFYTTRHDPGVPR